MTDITILYCTASLIPEFTAEKIRSHLLKVIEEKYPIVSVSQKPISFGQNICVGEIGQSNYNYFKQMLIGAKQVKTKYLVLCDDDTLYVAEHFTHRPSNENAFTYNTNTWIAGTKLFWRQKDMTGMFCHICPTDLLINNLTPRFEMYPIQPRDVRHFGEPGKFDTKFGIPNAKVETFSTKLPLVTFEYRGSLNGKRKRFGLKDPNSYTYDLKPFGNAKNLRKEYWNE